MQEFHGRRLGQIFIKECAVECEEDKIRECTKNEIRLKLTIILKVKPFGVDWLGPDITLFDDVFIWNYRDFEQLKRSIKDTIRAILADLFKTLIKRLLPGLPDKTIDELVKEIIIQLLRDP